jgi:hypothetical protein
MPELKTGVLTKSIHFYLKFFLALGKFLPIAVATITHSHHQKEAF